MPSLHEPWWYDALLVIGGIGYTLMLRAMWRFRCETKRHTRVVDERLARIEEDIAWKIRGPNVKLRRVQDGCGWEVDPAGTSGVDVQLALRLRRQRLARLKAVDPGAFVTAVKLAQTDTLGADMLIAEVSA